MIAIYKIHKRQDGNSKEKQEIKQRCKEHIISTNDSKKTPIVKGN
jgi:hypothetical protein